MFLPSIDPLPLIVGHQLSVRKVFSCLYMRSIEEGREFNGEMRLDTNAETAERALMMRVLSATRSADKSRSLLHHSPQHVETSSRSHHVQTPTRHRSDSHFLHAPKMFFSNTVWFPLHSHRSAMREMRREMVRSSRPPPSEPLVHLILTSFTQLSPVCDSYVRPETLVRICDECNFGTYGGRCIICGSPGSS